MCLHYTMVSQAIVLLTITMLPNLHKIVDECLDNFIHSPFVIYSFLHSFTINVTYFEHAKTLKSLSKVIFVSRLVGAQISRETCNLDKARSGITSPAPVWSWLGHGEAAVCLTSVLDAHQHLSIYCLSIQYQLALIFHNFCLWREKKKKRTKIQTMNEKC